MSTAKSFLELVGVSPSKATVSNSTLVIIDAQNEYADGHLKTVDVKNTRASIASLLDKYRAKADPSQIIHIVHQTPDGAPVFTPKTALAEEFAELTPKSGEHTITKQFPGSFTATDLDEHLKSLGEKGKQVVLTGYMAHVCVSTTARQAAEKGYDVILASDAIGDRDIPGASGEEVTRIALAELSDAFGTVVKGSEIN